jgi:hypothetical protein
VVHVPLHFWFSGFEIQNLSPVASVVIHQGREETLNPLSLLISPE